MAKTSIEWTDMTWNAVTGCTKVSNGCRFCYAERLANRFWKEEIQDGVTAEVEYFDGGQEIPVGTPIYRQRKFTDVICHDDRLDIPLHWKKPRRIFVNSMSDLFHPDVPFDFIDNVFETMHLSYWHTFQILTKRPEIMREYITKRYEPGLRAILPNVWLGVSVEDQKSAKDRIKYLCEIPAAVRFISYEPALESLDLNIKVPIPDRVSGGTTFAIDVLDWVIAGCESGPHARPANIEWFRSVKDQCEEYGVPFFLKQMMVDGKLAKMPELDGKVWSEFPPKEGGLSTTRGDVEWPTFL